MLLNLTVKNWMSYRDEASLNLMSTRERQHMETLSHLPKFRSKKVLPAVSIYGGNASGKTAMFKAIAALKEMVTTDPGVNGTLPAAPFALDDCSQLHPTTFEVMFLAGDNVYRFTVEFTRSGITYESLDLVRDKEEVSVYERDYHAEKPLVFETDLFSDPTHVEYAAKSTRANQTFLGSAVAQNIVELREAYEWFAFSLVTVGVGSNPWSFARMAVQEQGFLAYAGRTLARLDTGVVKLVGDPVGADVLPSDAKLLNQINELGEHEVMTLVTNKELADYGFELYTIRRQDGRPQIERLRTVHVGPDGKEHQLSLSEESSGTQRLMGLLPMLFDLTAQGDYAGGSVYVVDELDRCMHTMLTSQLIEDFVSTCNEDTRKQLLFTTHDLLLMDQSLLRRDEMYIAQRDADGCSELIGLSEYEGIRKDKDLIRSYLEGRFGGIPMLTGGEQIG